MQIQRTLHPTDFSPSARQALAEAVSLALAHDAILRIFHATLLHSENPLERGELDAVTAEARGDAERSRPGDGKALRIETASTRSVSAFDAIMGEIQQWSPDMVAGDARPLWAGEVSHG